MVPESSNSPADRANHIEAEDNRRVPDNSTPVRGSLRLEVAPSSPQVTAGPDFSIFVVIQNPFDVPVTVYQVQTHIPVELVDINGLKLERLRREREEAELSWAKRAYNWIKNRLDLRRNLTGTAIAVGTEFDPEEIQREFVSGMVDIRGATMGNDATVAGVMFRFPENPSSEELDRIFRRVSDYRKGLIPVTLQPGDSVVKQFVLRTRRRVFFVPLDHTFQIQVTFSSDGVDHSETISYEQSIRATIGAMALGAVCGAMIGSLLKSLTDTSAVGSPASLLQAIVVAILASIAVVIAFARKSTAQPVVSVEDFWGGVLVGFTTGFFGFDQFFDLFPSKQ